MKKQEDIEYFNKIKSTMNDNVDDNKDNKKLQDNEKTVNKKKIKGVNVFYYIKIIFVLAVVIAIIYLISLIIKSVLKIKGKVGEGGNIIISQPLGPGKWVQVVYIGGRYLILGITNERINLLSEVTDPNEIEKYQAILNEKKVEETGSFMDAVTDFFKNKIKKPRGRQKFDYEIDSVNFLKKQKDRINKINSKDDSEKES